tara:strand:- start:21342 stop:21617 length:276 start_codon:yes stop_codon:yes gene_type:complete
MTALWSKVDMLIELDKAIKEISYYIDRRPPRYDIHFWVNVRKRLRDRKIELEEFIYNGELDIPSDFCKKKLRSQIIELLQKQGVFKDGSDK